MCLTFNDPAKRHPEHALEISLHFRPGAGRLTRELAGNGRSSNVRACSNGPGGERVLLLELDQGQQESRGLSGLPRQISEWQLRRSCETPDPKIRSSLRATTRTGGGRSAAGRHRLLE